MKKILVIDDDLDILDAIQLVLTTYNYNSEILSRGDQAFNKVLSSNPDLIILDMLLSGSDGTLICKKLKEDERTKHIPIIMISAHPKAEETVSCCGADGFISKPFSVNKLCERVESLTH